MASHVIETAGNALFAPIAQRWLALRGRVAAQRAAQARRHRIARELNSYTDRELADLGVTRANFPEIINGTFRRD